MAICPQTWDEHERRLAAQVEVEPFELHGKIPLSYATPSRVHAPALYMIVVFAAAAANACAGDPCSSADAAAVDNGAIMDGVLGDDGSVAAPAKDASEPDADEPDRVDPEPGEPDGGEPDPSDPSDKPDGSEPDPVEPDASVACVDLNGPLSGDGLVPIPVTTAAQVALVPMSALGLAAHRSRGRLYALAAADDAEYPGELVIIDANTAEIIDAVSVVAEPSTLAITEDESKLWVGSLNRFELREVDLSGAVPELAASYALPAQWMSSSENLVVAAPAAAGMRPTLIDYRIEVRSSAFLGQVTLGSGQALASAASGLTEAQVVAGPPGWFFAYNSYDSGSELVIIDAGSSGLAAATSHIGLIAGSSGGITYDPDGLLYTQSGIVIDVRDPSAPRRVGRFAAGGKFLPIGNGRVLVVNTGFRTDRIVQMLDTATFKRLSSLQFDVVYDTMRSPVALSEDRVAFVASGEQGSGVFFTNAVATSLPLGRVEATSSMPGSIEVPIAARALVMDAVRGLLYAAVGTGAPAYENRVVVIEPSTGQIIESFDVGSGPMALALSDDGSILWVSLEAPGAVRRVDLSCVSESLASPAYTMPYQARPVRVFPIVGRPSSFAAQLGSLNSTAFYDDGVLRVDFDDQRSGASTMVAGPPGVLFAYENNTSRFGFLTISYDDEGLTSVIHESLLGGYYKTLAYDPDGFVYSSHGDVIDVRDPLQPSYVGRFAIDIMTEDWPAVLPLPGGPVALTVSGTELRRLDASTLSIGPGRTTGCHHAAEVIDLSRVAPGRVAFVGMKALRTPTSGSVCIVTDLDLIP